MRQLENYWFVKFNLFIMLSTGIALIDPQSILTRIGLVRGMRLADFGCGRTGHFVFPAARMVEDVGLVYAVDILQSVLENIKSRVRSESYDNIQLVWSDIEAVGKTPIPVDSLDVCLIVNVLNQLKDRVAGLREAWRLLKPGGLLVVIDWSKRIGNLGPTEQRMVSPAEVMALGGPIGFSRLDNFAAGDYHFCVVLKK